MTSKLYFVFYLFFIWLEVFYFLFIPLYLYQVLWFFSLAQPNYLKQTVKRERQNVMPSEQKLENHIWEDIFANQ